MPYINYPYQERSTRLIWSNSKGQLLCRFIFIEMFLLLLMVWVLFLSLRSCCSFVLVALSLFFSCCSFVLVGLIALVVLGFLVVLVARDLLSLIVFEALLFILPLIFFFSCCSYCSDCSSCSCCPCCSCCSVVLV